MTKLTDASITKVTSLDDTALFYAVDTTRAIGDQDVKIEKQDLKNELKTDLSVLGVNVLDYIANDTDKQKVIDRDDTQDATVITQAVNDAITDASTNDIRVINFYPGLWKFNKVDINAIDDLHIVAYGATLKYNSGNSILNFIDCSSPKIYGGWFTSDASAYSDVAFIRAEDNNSFLKIIGSTFENFPRAGIIINSSTGGVFTEGSLIDNCNFIDSPNY